MAAPCGSSQLPAAESPLKIPKMEVLSPGSPGALSDGNPSLSDPSTPSGASPLGPGGPGSAAAAAGAGAGGRGGGGASPSVSFSPGGAAAAAAAAACRGMSWTPAETNALIAVWGNERLVEARYQQLEGAGTVFGSKAPGPAMYERVSRALAELGYERTPSQCRERIKQLPKRQSELVRNAKYTLRRCYSRVKEHGVGKRKSSYTFEQLEQVFGQGGWDSQPCQPVLINSSGLYQELESDGSTMEEYSQEDWGNHSQDLHCYQGGDPELGMYTSSVWTSCKLACGPDAEHLLGVGLSAASDRQKKKKSYLTAVQGWCCSWQKNLQSARCHRDVRYPEAPGRILFLEHRRQELCIPPLPRTMAAGSGTCELPASA
ncbi:myb/SANT-like DNA-binding domain-containing protein 2 isoform 5-T5 [Macrochelys suwanniensis]